MFENLVRPGFEVMDSTDERVDKLVYYIDDFISEADAILAGMQNCIDILKSKVDSKEAVQS